MAMKKSKLLNSVLVSTMLLLYFPNALWAQERSIMLFNERELAPLMEKHGLLPLQDSTE
jgi:hypothetical protein